MLYAAFEVRDRARQAAARRARSSAPSSCPDPRDLCAPEAAPIRAPRRPACLPRTRSAAISAPNRSEALSRLHKISGGSSDTDANELMVSPSAPPAPAAVTTATPVAKWPKASRKARESWLIDIRLAESPLAYWQAPCKATGNHRKTGRQMTWEKSPISAGNGPEKYRRADRFSGASVCVKFGSPNSGVAPVD